jgi:hypothetical protein
MVHGNWLWIWECLMIKGKPNIGHLYLAAIFLFFLNVQSVRSQGSALICDARDGVSTGSGSDRVRCDNKIKLTGNLTRSLPLPVLTSSVKLGHYRSQQPPATRHNSPDAPCHHQELEEFAFLEGVWEVKLNNRLGDGKWEESTATSQIKRDLSGCVLMERLLGSRENRPFHVLSLFAFDNNSKRLQYLLSDSEHGLLALYQGRKTGNEILLDLEFVSDDGRKVTVRRAYSEIKKDSFSLESKHSRDGGKSWLTVMRARYARKLE